MPLSVSYRNAERADLASLVSMEKVCFPDTDRISRRSLARFLRDPRGTTIVDIILVDGAPCGYAIYLTRKSSERVRYYTICVLPAFSRRGIAEAYLRDRLTKFAPGYREIVLAVSKSNTASIRLHRKAGFTFVEEPSFRYPHGEEGVRMKKDLRPDHTGGAREPAERWS